MPEDTKQFTDVPATLTRTQERQKRAFDLLVARQPASIGDLVARPMPGGWSFMKAPRPRAAAQAAAQPTSD